MLSNKDKVESLSTPTTSLSYEDKCTKKHGEEIASSGFASVQGFIESVARNYTVVRRGKVRNGIDTYLLEVTDGNNNTLFVELSNDGSYWNVNSAGRFRTEYSKKKEVVWSLPALGTGSGTQSGEVADRTDDVLRRATVVNSGNSPQNVPSEHKGIEKNSEQGMAVKQPGESLLDYARRTRDSRSKPMAEEIRGETRDAEAVNKKHNEDLERLNEENKDNVRLNLGYPSPILRAGGVRDLPMLLYGNKLWAKMKKHGYRVDELRDLPLALQHPIAVFNNYGTSDNRSILTELKTKQGNVLVAITVKQEVGADVNVIASAFGKTQSKIASWISKGHLTYVDKEKALLYLRSLPAPIAGASLSSSEELISATKVVNDFENPKLPEDARFRKSAPFAIGDNELTHQLNAKQAKKALRK